MPAMPLGMTQPGMMNTTAAIQRKMFDRKISADYVWIFSRADESA
jgi:hypothetical protein